MGGLAISVALQLAVVYWEPLGRAFRTVPLPPLDLAIVVAVGSLVLWVEELRKLVAGRIHDASLVHGTSAPGP
jgi:Ca2+-transporting ATPase